MSGPDVINDCERFAEMSSNGGFGSGLIAIFECGQNCLVFLDDDFAPLLNQQIQASYSVIVAAARIEQARKPFNSGKPEQGGMKCVVGHLEFTMVIGLEFDYLPLDPYLELSQVVTIDCFGKGSSDFNLNA